jgi:hypothetical protein
MTTTNSGGRNVNEKRTSGGSLLFSAAVFVLTLIALVYIAGPETGIWLYETVVGDELNIALPSVGEILAPIFALFIASATMVGTSLFVAYVVQEVVYSAFNTTRLPKEGVETRDLSPLFEVRSHWIPATAIPVGQKALSLALVLGMGYSVLFFITMFTSPAVGLNRALILTAVTLMWNCTTYWDTEWHRRVDVALVTMETIIHKKVETPLWAVLALIVPFWGGESRETETESPMSEAFEISTRDEATEAYRKGSREAPPNSPFGWLARRILGVLGRELGIDNIEIITRGGRQATDVIYYVERAQLLVNEIRAIQARVAEETRKRRIVSERAFGEEVIIDLKGPPGSDFGEYDDVEVEAAKRLIRSRAETKYPPAKTREIDLYHTPVKQWSPPRIGETDHQQETQVEGDLVPVGDMIDASHREG